MPSKHQWEDSQAVENLKAVFDSPILLHVKTRILIHGRAKKGAPPCPCCGSDKVMIIEERPDLDLIIDRVHGVRKLRSEIEDKEGFDRLAQLAQQVDIPLRCHKHQLKLLLDVKHKIVAALGGNRSGKTTVGVYWLVRQWILKGGRGATFWWVSPQRSQTLIGVEKLVTGEYSDRAQPPALPLDPITGRPILVAKWPETERSSDQRIVLLDGSSIVLQHASRPTGANLKGRNIRAILVDELCEVKHRPNWTVMLNRLTDSGGSIFAASTPRPGHWAKDDVVDAAKTSKDIHVASLSIRDNPWMAKEEIARTIAVCRDEGEVAREIDGQWVSSKGGLYLHFDPRKHIRHDPSYNLPKDFNDVTAQACGSWWRGDNPYVRGLRILAPQFVGGMDVNCNPMTAIICKVFGDPRHPEKWGLYALDEVQLHHTDTWAFGNHLRGAAGEKARRGAVSYANIPLALDPTACTYDPTTPRGGYAKYSSSAARTMAELGFDARAANLSDKGHPYGVGRHHTTGLLQELMREDRFLINGTKCPTLMRAITEQENDGRGLAVKVTNTSSDRLSSPIDALAYLAWALFSRDYIGRTKAKIEIL